MRDHNTSFTALCTLLICTVRIIYLDTHALVNFEVDNSTSIVPLKRVIKTDNLSSGELCNVVWSNQKKYVGTLMYLGMLR